MRPAAPPLYGMGVYAASRERVAEAGEREEGGATVATRLRLTAGTAGNMSLYDLFRGFFRGGQRPRDPFFGGITRDEDDDDDDDEDGPSFRAQHPGDFGFGFSFSPGGMHFHDFGFEELFQDFNELFHEMEAWNFPRSPFEFPGIEAPPPGMGPPLPPGEKRQTLRDFMLKYPEGSRSHSDRAAEGGSRPTAPAGKPARPYQGLREILPSLEDLKDPAKEDRDLDSHVTSKGLETILPPAQPHSYFRSVSVTKVLAPDGTVEERRTVRDSEGREETVVTRRSKEGAPQSLDGRPQGGSAIMDDSSSILDTFLRWWSPGR